MLEERGEAQEVLKANLGQQHSKGRLHSEAVLVRGGHPHVIFNGRAEGRKASAAHGSSLRASPRAQEAAGDATSSNTVCKVILGPKLQLH